MVAWPMVAVGRFVLAMALPSRRLGLDLPLTALGALYGNGCAILKTRNQITGAEFIHRGDEATFTAQSG